MESATEKHYMDPICAPYPEHSGHRDGDVSCDTLLY